jgi:hypothetical protein
MATVIHTSVHCSFIATDTCTTDGLGPVNPELEFVPLLPFDCAVIIAGATGYVVVNPPTAAVDGSSPVDEVPVDETRVMVVESVRVLVPESIEAGKPKPEFRAQVARSSPFTQQYPATAAQYVPSSQYPASSVQQVWVCSVSYELYVMKVCGRYRPGRRLGCSRRCCPPFRIGSSLGRMFARMSSHLLWPAGSVVLVLLELAGRCRGVG